MDQYILYGNVRDRSLKDMTEYYIRNNGGEVLFYVDDRPDKENMVFSPDRIKDYPEAIVVILAAMSYKKILNKLMAMGGKNRVYMAPLLGWRFIIDPYIEPKKYIEYIPKWIENNKETICKIYDLTDACTSELLKEIIDQRTSFCFIDPKRYNQLSYVDYFADEKVSPKRDFILFDGGTYIGDTIININDAFRNKLKYVIGFEPDEDNFQEALKRIKEAGIQDKVVISKKGLWNIETKLRFKLVGDEYSIDKDGCLEADVTSIDACNSILNRAFEQNINNDTDICIKLDIEGSEIRAIEGAKQTILQYHPYMVVCLYHRMKDILDVPKVIKSIRDDYRFYLRAGVHTELYGVPVRGE